MNNEDDKNNKSTPDYIQDFLNKTIKDSIEQNQQQYIVKFNEELEKYEKKYIETLEVKTKELKKEFKEELKDIREGTRTKWLVISGAVIVALAGIISFIANEYIKSLNLKFKDYQTFCEKIVDEKIKNITLKK